MSEIIPDQLCPAVALYAGDCLDVLKVLAPDSVDAFVTDPPYGLGFMGRHWDHGVPGIEYWQLAVRVLKPGGHLVAFSGTRTYHRMVVAIEDAGFEIRDQIGWAYGSGFPKSLDVSKAIDKFDAVEARLARRYAFTEWFVSVCGLTGRQIDDICSTNTMGRHWTDCRPNGKQPDVPTREYFELLRPHIRGDVPDWVELLVDERTVESENFKRREVVATKEMRDTSEVRLAVTNHAIDYDTDARREVAITAAHTPQAVEWSGWGTALKPAWEPIVLARKPLSEGTVAANVLRWRTGALNIDACRVATTENLNGGCHSPNAKPRAMAPGGAARSVTAGEYVQPEGRWPANVVHDGSEEVVGAFPETTVSGSADKRGGCEFFMNGDRRDSPAGTAKTETGSAARFFYTAKADQDDRIGSKHPTVKPVDLMQWLARLVTPPGGLVLDPFAGTGTTGEACMREGFRAVLIERESEYQDDIRRRIKLAMAGPEERSREIAKAKSKDKPLDPGPLFSTEAAE